MRLDEKRFIAIQGSCFDKIFLDLSAVPPISGWQTYIGTPYIALRRLLSSVPISQC